VTEQFHILLVPIAQPRLLQGLVSLESCLEKFAQVEELGGSNAVRCDHCNLVDSLSYRPNSVVGAVTSAGNHVSMILSPIAGGNPPDGLGNPANGIGHQRTSTPKRPPVLSNCRRRTLIGYLPSCLVIQLMRFSIDSNQSSKLSLPLVIPLTGLNLSHYVLRNAGPAECGLSEQTDDRYNLYAMCVHLGSDSTANGHYIAYARCANNGWYCFDDEHVYAVDIAYELTTRRVRENAYLLFYERAL